MQDAPQRPAAGWPLVDERATSPEARGRALWQRVQALEAQVEALEAEVLGLRKALRGRLRGETRSPRSQRADAHPRPGSACSESKASGERGERTLAPSVPGESVTAATPVAADPGQAPFPGEAPPQARSPVIESPEAEYRASEGTQRAPRTSTQFRLRQLLPNDLLGNLWRITGLPALQLPQHPAVERLMTVLTNLAWLGVLACLAAVFVLVNYVLPGSLSASLSTYVVQPFIWSYLACMALLCWWYGLEDRPPLNKPVVGMAVLIGAVQIALSVIVGLFLGFGRSPYSHQFLALLGNLAYAGTMLLGTEMSRACFVVVLNKRSSTLALVVPSLLLSLASLPVAKFRLPVDTRDALRLLGETLLPTLSQNLLASFLALFGGPVASLAYRGILLAFEWLSPILPNLRWIVAAFLGTLAPILGVLVIHSQFSPQPAEKEEEKGKDQTQDRQLSVTWVLVALMAIALLWFNTGMFGVRPNLIASNSMTPELWVGDIVVTRDVPPEAIDVGDVIRFRQRDVYIVHRVVEVQTDGSEITLITRGDANSAEDPPVPARDLAGKVILTVPKVGWVPIGIRKVIEWIL